jgi:hypothetical protein
MQGGITEYPSADAASDRIENQPLGACGVVFMSDESLFLRKDLKFRKYGSSCLCMEDRFGKVD